MVAVVVAAKTPKAKPAARTDAALPKEEVVTVVAVAKPKAARQAVAALRAANPAERTPRARARANMPPPVVVLKLSLASLR